MAQGVDHDERDLTMNPSELEFNRRIKSRDEVSARRASHIDLNGVAGPLDSEQMNEKSIDHD